MTRFNLLVALMAFSALFLGAFPTHAQSEPTIIESEGEAHVEVTPDEAGFRIERSFSGPTLTEAMRQVRAFERSVAQAITDLEIKPSRQEPVRVRIRQRSAQLEASLVLWLAPQAAAPGTASQVDALVDAAERLRKLAISVSANVRFAGYAITDREPAEQEAVARAAENALYLADAAGALAQRHVVDMERLTILETRWEGVDAAQDGAMPIPPEVTCHARVRIDYRYEAGPARR